ncbi:acyltransferase family protein [Planctomicrobium piriforme]|uniref:Predicted acyltransferase n=1 Tax=Planctomicrobium piriforme TaxID=1576369 RepID=A0A1I3EA40_9PLAN|nr:hypothetical protein [Planctomicrobium piriforme]SFH95824.1 Predicted acyltransferase [Planctomicrobium piriforme]
MTYRIKEDPPEADVIPPVAATSPKPDGDRSHVKRKRVSRYPERLTSLDAYRGFIMLMLAAHGFGLAHLARSPDDSPLWKILDRPTVQRVAFHFDHPPWQSSFVPGTQDAAVGAPWLHVGVSFWDLIQPAFMFMVGVAMPFSFARRRDEGDHRWRRAAHAFLRAVILVLMGVFLYSLGHDGTNWIFPNVLAQIGLGYFFVYLLLGRKIWIQGLALIAILVGTWAALHFYALPGDYRPAEVNAKYERGDIYKPPYQQWSKNGNVFHAFDVWFLNLFPRPADEGPFLYNRGGYQTLNFVPSMATMILGLLCGELLMSGVRPGEKFACLLVAALVCWGLGVLTGATCCPIVKRIWTPSWVLFSGGYVMGLLALFYLVFDLWPFKKLAFPLVVIGVNSILVYFLGELTKDWLAENVQRHFGWAIDGALGWLANTFHLLRNLDVPPETAGAVMHSAFLPVVEAVSAVTAIWLLCLWLYRQRLFLRI